MRIHHAGCFQAESLSVAPHRSCKYLNNTVEQDHRRIKSRVQPMLGFKKFYNTKRVLIGVGLLQKLSKDQYRVPRSFGRTLDAIWSNVLAA